MGPTGRSMTVNPDLFFTLRQRSRFDLAITFQLIFVPFQQRSAMTKRVRILLALQLLVLFCTAQVAVQHLLTENLSNPIGLDTRMPRFSWQLSATERNELQTAYEIRVSTKSNGKAELWNSGKVYSAQSVHVAYGGPAPASGRRYFWQVRVWDNKGRNSAWSEYAWWQTGLLDPSDWTAK